MRKRIEQLANGEFWHAGPCLSFSVEKVEIEVLEGRDFTGDFVITSENHVPMRGIIYTSDARMECLTPQFEGEEVRIQYQFHSNGLIEGDIQKGEFYIICNQGEYNLSFVAVVSKHYAETSIGRVECLSDFVKLAKQSPKEAQHLFYSRNFKNIFQSGEIREQLLYAELSMGIPSGQKLEEFLLGIGKKKPVYVTLTKQEAAFYEVRETRRETVELSRRHWGYMHIQVHSDAEFLVPVKAQLTEEDFIGSVCTAEYYIEETAMHAGKNFGKLFFTMPGVVLCFQVCASRGKRPEAVGAIKSEHREIKECRARLMQLYMDFRLKKIVTGAWAKQSVELLNHLMILLPDEKLYPLMKAQALLVNKQRQEAEWIMEDYRRTCKDRETPEWGYYLYLCTLAEREPSYVDKIAEEIELLFKKNPDSALLFWVLLFVRESYHYSASKRYRAIEQWVTRGCHSPYLYLEAYYLLWQDPYLLGKLGAFEVAVLSWARKQGAISKDIALQVMYVAGDLRTFDVYVYRILEECYRIVPKEEMLAVICGYLIKGQCYEVRYHRWYALGIEQELRITGLYEAYLLSMDAQKVGSVPKALQMYFQYDSILPYQKRAALFVNIIAQKEQQPRVYQQYRGAMETFAAEQLKAGHIDDDLAVIYEEMLHTGLLYVDAAQKDVRQKAARCVELAQDLSDILFVHKLTCLEQSVVKAEIRHAELSMPQVVPVINQTAYFSAYTDNYVIILEDTAGNRFCKGIMYQDEALLHPERYLKQCLALAPKKWSYVLAWYVRRKELPRSAWEMRRYMRLLLEEERLCMEFRQEVFLNWIPVCQQGRQDGEEDAGMLHQYLERTDLEGMSVPVRRRLTELLLREHLYEKAYRMVQQDGYNYLGPAVCEELCSYAITSAGFEEEDFLLGFAAASFGRGVYNDVILTYLCRYYHASTKRLAKLWHICAEHRIDTCELEECILTQMLYTTDYTPYAEQIYDSYCKKGGSELVREAYLSYFADSYLRQDMVVPEHVFVQLAERYEAGKKLNDACKLGMLKHLAEYGVQGTKRAEWQLAMADALLAEYMAKNLYLACYRSLPDALLRKYHLCDKFFLEYHTTPERQVWVHFRIGTGAYQVEKLTEVYRGIYVQVFLLFYGETVQYYIAEEQETESAVMESGCIGNETAECGMGSRYARLNRMLMQNTLDETEELKLQMKYYYDMSQVTDEVFKLL